MYDVGWLMEDVNIYSFAEEFYVNFFCVTEEFFIFSWFFRFIQLTLRRQL